jgi:PAS domain S-box-containing protein
MTSTSSIPTSNEAMAREIDDLRTRLAAAEGKLAEAQELIHAIQQGDVDAVVVSGPAGDQVFSLKDAEYGYRALVEAMSEGAATLTADGTVLYCNERLAHLLEVPLETIIGNFVIRQLSDESALAIEAMLRQALSGKSITTGLDLRTVEGKCIPVQISIREMKSLASAVCCMVVTDLTESKARDALVAEGRLATLILQSAAEAIAVCDAEGRVIVSNHALEKLCGCNPVFRPFDEVLPLEWLEGSDSVTTRSVVGEALTGTTFIGRKARFCRRDGRLISLLISSSPMRSSGSVTGCVLTLTDITEREGALEATRKSNAVLDGINRILHAGITCETEHELGKFCLETAKTITQSQVGFIGSIGTDGLQEITISNPGWEACKKLDVAGERDASMRFKLHGIYGRVLVTGKSLFTNDPAHHVDAIGLPAGHPPIQAFLGVPLIQEGCVVGMIAVANRDGGYTEAQQNALEALTPSMTEAFLRKRAEEALRDSLRRERERAEELAVLFESVPVPVFIARDPDCLHLTGNRLAEEMLRTPSGNELSMSGPEETRPRHFRTFKDGRELRLEELPAQRSARGEHVRDFEFSLVFDDGEVRHALGYGNPLLDSQGRPRGTVATMVDITEQKRAEERLGKLNRALKSLSNSNQAVLHASDETEFLEQICSIITRDCDYAMVWIGAAEHDEEKTVRPLVFSGVDQGYLKAITITWDESKHGRGPTGLAIRTGEPSVCRNMHTDPKFARWRERATERGYASSLAIPLKQDGESWGAITIYSRETDAFLEGEIKLLTELAADVEFGIQTLRTRAAHARAEEALLASKELLAQFVEHAPAALAMFDRQMRYLHVSRRWKTDHGLGEREMRGESHYDELPAISEEWKEAHRRGLAGEVLSSEDERTIGPDGSEQWCRWEVRPWRDAEGKVGGIVVFSEDITERKKAAAALLRSETMAFQSQQLQALAARLQQAREAERKKVARDLHDQIGQILTAIKMDMAWTLRHLPRDAGEVQDRLTGSIELINEGVRSVRSICSGLRPGVLDDLGLAAAIEWQANEVAARTGLVLKVSIPCCESRLDGDRATAVFRIFQECLTNVARHAEAKTVRTSLYEEDDDLVLVVEDDGKGFLESKAAGSLGVLGMKERAQGCGGDLQISSYPGKGTTVTLRVPVRITDSEREDHANSDRR